MTIPNFKIKCSDALMAELEKHCFSETKVEVGGFLVGYIDGAVAEVTHVIPAEHSVGKSTQLTFTHDTWNALHSKMNDLDGTLIGWYHSHPNFGVFLSEHDQFIQQNFFKQEGNITIVIDPVRGRRGWFYSSNSKIVKYEKEVDTTRARLGKSATNSDENIEAVMGKSSGGVSLGKVVGISMITSLLGAFLGFGLNSATGSSATQQKQINELTQTVGILQQVLINEGFIKIVNPAIPEVPVAPTATPKATPKTTPKATASPSAKPSTSVTTAKPSTTAKSSTSPKASASPSTSKKSITTETKTAVVPTKGAACNPAKDTKPVGTLKCDTKTKKWIGSKSLSPITTPSTPASTETKTGTN
jgi:proteasome lid subunit RPN8/RPN11